MVASVPALMAIMMMTAATPMMMPSMVRKERTLFLKYGFPGNANGFRRFHAAPSARCDFAVMDNVINQSVHQIDRALGMRGDLRVVGHHDDGRALGMQLCSKVHDLFAGVAVQVAGRFIGDDQRRGR